MRRVIGQLLCNTGFHDWGDEEMVGTGHSDTASCVRMQWCKRQGCSLQNPLQDPKYLQFIEDTEASGGKI